MDAEAAAQDEKLADEPIQNRQADERESSDDEERSVARHLRGEAAIGGDVVGSKTLVEEAEQDQQGAAADLMAQDLVNRTVDAGDDEAEDAEGAEAQSTHRGVGGQALHVFLDERYQGTIEESNDREANHPGCDLLCLGGEESKVEAQDRIEAEFAGDDHGKCGRRFADHITQPSMERKDGDLDRESDEKGECCPEERLLGQAKGPRCQRLANDDIVEAACLGIEPENRDQEERRGQEGVKEKFDRCLRSTIATEHRDGNGHRHERELPEGVVQEHIQRDEDANHRCPLQQQEEIELFGAGSDGLP
jgi:hypothetical protein